MDALRLKVCGIGRETDLVRSLRLGPVDGETLPPFTAGSHIAIHLPQGGTRQYSLVAIDDAGDAAKPDSYRLGIRLESEGKGGSRYMHALSVGDVLTASPPRNDFPIHAGAERVLLIAGGIGITPIATMGMALAAQGADYTLHYSGRSRGSLAFLGELSAVHGERLAVHYDDDASAIDLRALVRDDAGRSDIYVCGPRGMIEAVREAAAAHGYDKGRVHFELFTQAASGAGDSAFEVELHSSGQVVQVPAGCSIIEALEGAGIDLVYDCRRGDCGICQTRVLGGIPDHRDVILTDAERASNTIMQICVSRARSERLVLDL